jgi:hypothetical protein
MRAFALCAVCRGRGIVVDKRDHAEELVRCPALGCEEGYVYDAPAESFSVARIGTPSPAASSPHVDSHPLRESAGEGRPGIYLDAMWGDSPRRKT